MDRDRGERGALAEIDLAVVVRALPAPCAVLTPDLLVLEVNAALLAAVGRERHDLVGRPFVDALTGADRTAGTGGADGTDRVAADPVDSWVFSPLPGTGDAPALLAQRAEDVDAELPARAQEPTSARAARGSAAELLGRRTRVAQELAAARSVEELERIVVGHGLAGLGADGGAIASARPGGWRVTVGDGPGPRARATLAELPHDSPHPSAWVARTGRRLLLPTRASGPAFHPAAAQLHADTGRAAWAVLPLVVDGERLGSLAVAWTEERVFRGEELAALDGFAAQCARALHRLRSDEAAREAAASVARLAEALQRSLLTRPPCPPCSAIAVRYRPASRDAQVGGDWYDAFVTAAGATLLVVGDVEGHDRTAAAVMGQLRNLLRGMSYDSPDGPAALLTRLDRAMRGLEIDALATAVLARVEPGPVGSPAGSKLVRWASAGHPPPLLRRADATTAVLESEPDLLLGVSPDARRRESCVVVGPGESLLLYTDGLVERRADGPDAGLARLRETLGAQGWREPEDLCDALLAELADDLDDDDVALLVLRPLAPGTDGCAP